MRTVPTGEHVLGTALPGVLVIELDAFRDARGSFVTTWSGPEHAALGVTDPFDQDATARSKRGVLRGLHIQHPAPQAKLVLVAEGEVFDVLVDLRAGSPTFGRWMGLSLSGRNRHQVYVPPGLAHGYCVTSARATVCYKITAPYVAEDQLSLAWDDPDVAIPWPVACPVLSARDRAGVSLRSFRP